MARDDYNPVNEVSPTTQGIGGFSVRANPDSFGAQGGVALQNTGKQIQSISNDALDLYNKYKQQATEAKVNSRLVNEWAPVADSLKRDYELKRGQDKIKGYDDYVNGLDQGKQKILESASSDEERMFLSSAMNKHIETERSSALKSQINAINDYEDNAHADFLLYQGNRAAENYNNPQVADDTVRQMDGLILKHGMDRGLSEDQILDNQRMARSNVSVGMVNKAISDGNPNDAYRVYKDNQHLIPGYQQTVLENKIYSQGLSNTCELNTDAFLSGNGLPEPVASPARHVQHVVASVAISNGVDPNHALAVARIESRYGQNTGTRGDVGQTGKGGDLYEQTLNMIEELKKSHDIATSALGRNAEPWEDYACYQQGEGGGPALFMASQNDPKARAVDVLAPLYKTRGLAVSAIINNGGTRDMTASQFLDFLKNKYNTNAKRALCEVPQAMLEQFKTPEGGESLLGSPSSPNIADAIGSYSNQNGIPMQPSATPQQALANFNEVYPDALMRAQAIPNIEEREGTIRALNARRAVYVTAAEAAKKDFNLSAQKLALDPKFTDLRMMPTEMLSAMSDNPLMLDFMQKRAEYNAKNSQHIVTMDQIENGVAFNDLLMRVYLPSNDPDSINSVDKLYGPAGREGTLTQAGFDRINKELSIKKSPEGQSIMKMKYDLLSKGKYELSASNKSLGTSDPKGDELFRQWSTLALSAYDKGIENKKTPEQLLNPESLDYVGNTVNAFKRNRKQVIEDLMQSIPLYGSLGALPAEGQKPMNKPPEMKDRVIGRIYDSPNGPMKWMGDGWQKVNNNKPSVPISE